MAVAKDLRALMPEGDPYQGPWIKALLDSIAVEFDRLDVSIEGLPWEVNPSSTTQLLDRWESLVGLPEEDKALQDSASGRRSDILIKLNATGGQSAAYIEGVLRTSGYDVSISSTDTKPFTAGSSAGDMLTQGWGFVFIVLVRGVSLHFFTVGEDTVGSPLASWDNSMMYRIVERIKPAHTKAVFLFDSWFYYLLDETGEPLLTESGENLEV